MGAKVTFQDLAAGLVSLILVIGLVYLAATRSDIPASLAMGLGSATTWLFIRTVVPEKPTTLDAFKEGVAASPAPILEPQAQDSEPLSKP